MSNTRESRRSGSTGLRGGTDLEIMDVGTDTGATGRKPIRVPECSGIRRDLVERTRREIEAGTYETAERIDKAVERLLDDLLGT
jgi:hypothetical protein